MKCEELHPLLAGYVDDEISTVERQAVEEHVAGCSECRALLQEQEAVKSLYAGYPVDEPTAAQWQKVWQSVGERLPVAARRISLESLTEIDIGSELDEEEGAAEESEPMEEEVAPAAEEPVMAAGPARATTKAAPKRPHTTRGPLFKPIRIPRLKHTFWAHLAGVAAAVALVVLVFMSVKPVIHQDQLANVDQVQFQMDITDAETAPVIIMLETDQGDSVPMIWIAHATDTEVDSVGGKESTQ